MAVEDYKENRPLRPENPSFRKNNDKSDNIQDKKPYLVLTPFPYGIKKATNFLEKWIKDEDVTLSHVDRLPTEENLRDPNYCPYHRRKGHNLEQCMVF